MPRPSKKAAAAPRIPKVGDRVIPSNSSTVYVISKVHYGGDEVDLAIKDTLIEPFRVRTDRLTYLDKAKPEPVPDLLYLWRDSSHCIGASGLLHLQGPSHRPQMRV